MDQLTMIVVAVVAAVAAYSISIEMGKGGVFGSAVVTLIAGVLFKYLETEGFITITGLAVVATTAGYAGMAAQKNIANVKEMAIVGLITGILYIAGANAFIGVGGRLGTIAAISCFSWVGFKSVTGFSIQSPKTRY